LRPASGFRSYRGRSLGLSWARWSIVRSPYARYLLPAVAVAVGVGLRLYLASSYYGNYDQASYSIVGTIVLRGGNVYAETDRYNYSPVWSWILWCLAKLAIHANLGFPLVIRGFLTLVDIGNAVLIGLIAERTGRLRGTLAFSIYLLNPVAILIVGYHGQFDTLASLPLLLATYLMLRQPDSPPRRVVWLLGTAAILVKQLAVFGALTLFTYAFAGWRRWLALGLAGAVFAATFLPYLPAGWPGIVQNVLRYSSLQGFYGLSQLPPVLNRPIFFAVMLPLPVIARDRLGLSVERAMALTSVALLVFIYGISTQYFLLPILFGTVILGWAYWLYTAMVTLFLLMSPFNLHLLTFGDDWPFPITWNVVWLCAVTWLVVGRWFQRPKLPPARRWLRVGDHWRRRGSNPSGP
jgi:hypothetical protein